MFAAQILEGMPWGIFIANAPAYCSEIVPLRLRAPATQMLQMFWAIGSIIVGGVTVVVWKQIDTIGLYEIIPGFILATIAIVVVTLITPAPEGKVADQFDDMASRF